MSPSTRRTARALLHLVVLASGALAAAPARGEAQPMRAERHAARIVLDSAVVLVETGRVVAETPTGAFRISTDAATLAAWAEAAAKLRAPRASDGAGQAEVDAIMLSDHVGEVRMRLARIGPDSFPVYRLDVADAAFSYAARVSPQQWQALRGALAGEWRDTTLRECSEALPCYEFQTDEPARPEPGNALPDIPGFVDRSVDGTRVRVEFVVGADGRPRPETIIIARSPHPSFSKDLREAVSRWRFRPARKDGQAVPVVVLQLIEIAVRAR